MDNTNNTSNAQNKKPRTKFDFLNNFYGKKNNQQKDNSLLGKKRENSKEEINENDSKISNMNIDSGINGLSNNIKLKIRFYDGFTKKKLNEEENEENKEDNIEQLNLEENNLAEYKMDIEGNDNNINMINNNQSKINKKKKKEEEDTPISMDIISNEITNTNNNLSNSIKPIKEKPEIKII